MDSGIHHQPRRAEQLGLERAESVVGVGFEALLERQVLGIQPPALGERRERDDAAKEREILPLHGDRDLEMVARHRLVVGERAHVEAHRFLGIAEVRVEDAGARAVERGIVVVAAGCRGLELGDAQVSELHCNFLINLGGASAADIENLGEAVRARVKAHSGVDLEWEIKRIGVAK